MFNFLRGVALILVIIFINTLSLQAGENLMTKLKPLPDGQISTVYIGQTNYTELSGRLKTIDILTRFILEPQSNRLFGDSLIDYGEGIERSVIKILRVSLNKITIKEKIYVIMIFISYLAFANLLLSPVL